MLYCGYFKFEARNGCSGSFTAILELGDSTDVLPAFAKLIKRAGRDTFLFGSGTNIYVESILEIQKIPKQGLITYCQQSVFPPETLPVTLNNLAPYPPTGKTVSCIYPEANEENKPIALIPLVEILDET
jgi:hypothetical protein